VTNRKVLFKSEDIRTMISGIAESIIQNHKEQPNRLALVGIRTGGVYLMERIHKILKKRLKTDIPTGIVDITLYRDDIDTSPMKPTVGETELLFDVNDRYIILVDDVLYTGRTIRAAIDVLIDFGRPKKIEPAVLIEREEKYREIPIYAMYRGNAPKTEEKDRVTVRFFEETGREDEVILERR